MKFEWLVLRALLVLVAKAIYPHQTQSTLGGDLIVDIKKYLLTEISEDVKELRKGVTIDTL